MNYEFDNDLMVLLQAKGNATHKVIAANLHSTSYDREKAHEAEDEYEDKLQAFRAKWFSRIS